MKHPRVARSPVLEQRPPFVDEEPRALEELLAPLERDLGEALRQRGRRDRRVVLYLKRGLDALARPDHPSDSQAGKSVDLREPAGHEDPLAASAERRALLRRAFGAAVDLVREDPGAVLIGDAHDALDLGLGQDLSGRVVRLADADHLRARVHGGRQRVEVDGPRALFAQPDLAHPRAERRREAVHLHVVRHDDDDLVARGDEGREREEVRLARAGRDHHVVGLVPGMDPSDECAGGLASDALGVAELRLHQLFRIASDLREGERLDARFGEVVCDLVLPLGLHALHVKARKLHRQHRRFRKRGRGCESEKLSLGSAIGRLRQYTRHRPWVTKLPQDRSPRALRGVWLSRACSWSIRLGSRNAE